MALGRFGVTFLIAVAASADHNSRVDQALARARKPGLLRAAIGVTRQGTAIPGLITSDDLDYHTPKTRVLLVGGLDGSSVSVDAVLSAIEWFYTAKDAARWRRSFVVSAVPIARPDAWATGAAAAAAGEFPPAGEHYSSATDPEGQYLWRWIGMHAPDVVIDVRASSDPPRATGLASALGTTPPSGTGTVRAIERGASRDFLRTALPSIRREPSAARLEIQRRLERTPLEIARQLAARYGHELPAAVYIPAVAIIGRLRLGDLIRDSSITADVERIVEPYFSGAKPALAKPTGSHLSGHLIFAELAERTRKQRYLDLVRAAADLGFDAQGRPLESMPMHSEMSDAVFMSCPILARAGRLTVEGKYFDMSVRHMRFMLKLNLRADGLHRHSPLDETAWGRGNGFPALGLALSLEDMPAAHPGRGEMLSAFRAHMNALAAHQDATGMWHQVIDRPESYRELTATAMIAFALERGVRNGWIDGARFRPRIDRAWSALRTRIAPDGSLVDVCTGTGKQRSLRDYYDRPAILGPDPRGGAMALLIATEMASRPAPPTRGKTDRRR